MLRDYLYTAPPIKDVNEIMNILEEKLGVHILVCKNDYIPYPNNYFDVIVSSSTNKTDVLLDRELIELEWPCVFKSEHDINEDRGKRGMLFEKSVYGVVSWMSRGNILYRSSINRFDDITNSATIFSNKVKKYAEIPSFKNVSELKMKLDLRGVT